MPDTKITALAAITTVAPANDLFPIVDVSDNSMAASGTTKNITVNQLLGAGGTATLASATITGDLTVRTNKLKVTSVGAGCGTATPESELDVRGLIAVRGSATFPSTGVGLEAYYSSSNTSSFLQSYDRGGSAFVNLSYNALSHIFQLSGGTAMTLNSTGLGVGGSPASKLYVYGANVSGIGQFRIDCPAAGVAQQTFAINGVAQGQVYADGTQFVIGSATSTPLLLRTANTVAVTIDASQNVGVGVVPSATSSTYYQSLEIGRVGQGLTGAKSALTGSPNSWFSNNSYATYSAGVVWKYAVSQPAAQYRLVDASHLWYTASSGNAGDDITAFATAKMTLDASGNLLVGKSSASVPTVGFQSLSNGETSSTMASSTSAATTLNVYSTGATAYRFYVGLNGTINATNTTISAISDARLKENVQDIDVGLGAILALKPRKFDWKSGKGKDIKGDRGFIAQEFEQVFPNLVDEWKDAAPEGEAPYKSVRQDLIPVLVKAIQELTARVAALEA